VGLLRVEPALHQLIAHGMRHRTIEIDRNHLLRAFHARVQDVIGHRVPEKRRIRAWRGLGRGNGIETF
jgi:hypothetical protein